MVAHGEQAVLAQRLIADTCQKQVIKPEGVHYGRTDQIIKERNRILKNAFENHPERFKGKLPNVNMKNAA